MITTVLILHLCITTSLVAMILLQRSEGGGLATGGGGMGSFMSARGTADLLTRTTGILAAGFFITSLWLAILYRGGGTADSTLFEESPEEDTVVEETQVPQGPAVAEEPPLPTADEPQPVDSKK